MAAVRHFSSSLASFSSSCSSQVLSRGVRSFLQKTWIRGNCVPGATRFFWCEADFQKKCGGWTALRRRKSAGRMFSLAAAGWTDEESPYDILGLERDVNDDGVKSAYRRLAKIFHPDVYDGSTTLLDGETAEGRFIKIQAAYELLMDKDQRRQYDMDHRTNPMKASKSWMAWVIKKKKAFEQRGDMAVSAWAEQQQREMNLKARQLARHKIDPEEERKLLFKKKQATVANFETTVRRHSLVLKKRDILKRNQDEEDKKKLIRQLLAAEGLELDDDSL